MPLLAALVLVMLVAGACSGGSSSGGAPGSSGPASRAPAETPFDRYRLAAPTAVRYARALALGRSSAAGALADPGGAAGSALAALGARLRGLPIAAARATPSFPSSTGHDGADEAAVALELRARLSRAAPSEWVLLGRRVLLLHRSAGAWKVTGDLTSQIGIAPTGLFLYTHPALISGQHATVVFGPGTARGAARQIVAEADRVAPGMVARYGGGPAAERPLIFLVNGRAQGEQLSGTRIDGSTTPLGTVSGNFTYVFLRPYQQGSALERNGSIVYLMTLLAARFNLFHAPESLVTGVAAYEQNAYLNTKGYIVPLDRIAAAYPGYASAATWRVTRRGWGVTGSRSQLAFEDALAIAHVIEASHGGPAAVIRLGKRFKAIRLPAAGGRYSTAQLDRAFRAALGVSFATVAGEAHSYVAGGSWKFG